VLERHAQCDGDVVLTAAVRLSNVASDILEATHNRHGQTEHQDRLLLLGVEARLREEQRRIPTLPSQGGPNSLLKHISMFLDVYIDGCGLLVIPRLKFSAPSLPPLSGRLYPCVVALRAFMDDLERHDRATMAAFTCLDWGRFVLAIVLGFRLSFYMTECPDFDSAWARQTLRLSEFLGLMSGDGDGDNDDGTSTSSKASKAVPTSAASKVDVLSASRVVFGVVRDKYDKRVEGAERAARAAEAAAKIRQPLDCPMLDGSLEEYLPLWDPSIAGGKAGGPMGIGMGMGAGPGAGTGTGAAPLHAHDTGRPQPIFHDLWATMTMGWASEDVEDREETF
jgi:hypothetical protein